MEQGRGTENDISYHKCAAKDVLNVKLIGLFWLITSYLICLAYLSVI